MEIIKMPNYKHIYYIDSFEEAFKSQTGNNNQYRKWLLRQLNILDERGKKAIVFKAFEKLNNKTYDIYSMRYDKSQLNLRILYIFFDEDAILLIPFKEKSSLDYDKAIAKAENIYKELDKEE